MDIKEIKFVPARKLFNIEILPCLKYVSEDDDFIYLQMSVDQHAHYPIEKDRCETHSSILSWVLHLSRKGWVTKKMRNEFIIRATNHAGINPYVVG